MEKRKLTMGIIVSIAALSVIALITLDALNMMPQAVEEIVVKPEPNKRKPSKKVVDQLSSL